ncbi:hypothetical protein SORBI_3005G201800 [Sorghum bicolor]|uniref:F-box domain-containing protein n=1 Tax=Sorghum bicolor TaxID=4558 RepID=A0A1Z5RJN2_SORBI|nr:hypothetical protein SORBI_3005G201800 [Sorghum bicolor]
MVRPIERPRIASNVATLAGLLLNISDDDAVCVSLPEDVVFAVLVRLPLKALCRFRCVSKAWRALISDPGFRSHAGPLIVGVFGLGRTFELELRVLDTHGDVLRVLEVKNCAALVPTRLDLVCVDMMRHRAMIVDPATRRAFTVGRDDDRLWSNFGFGRATPSGAYKVLRFYVNETHETVCDVATITDELDDDGVEPTWRQRSPPITCFCPKHKATVNGVIYFMPYMTYTTTAFWNRVAGFDLESEAWMETINGPPLGPEVLQFFNPSTEAFTDIKEMAQQCNGMALYTGSLLST